MINVEIMKVHAGQILPYERVTGNKEFTIGDLNNKREERKATWLHETTTAVL